MSKKKTAPKKVFFNDVDVSAIALDASEKLGWVDITVHAPGSDAPLPDLRNALHPKDYTVRISGHVRVTE